MLISPLKILNMKKFVSVLFLISVVSTNAQTQKIDSLSNKLKELTSEVSFIKNLKITGWVQAQYQWTQTNGAKTFDGGDFASNSNSRFMIRRGRVKFTYTNNLVQTVLQLNATERGVNLVDIYGKVTDPWTKSFSLTAGVMNRPFGFEIQQSSSERETPERARFTQLLIPNERDLGGMLSFQPIKGKKLFGLKIDAGLYNGVGIAVPGTTSLNGSGLIDFDSYKDFIGRIYYKKSLKDDKINFGLGCSHYNGGFVYQNNRVFNQLVPGDEGPSWNMRDTINNTSLKGKKAPRIYYDFEGQFSVKTKLGTTTLRGEYIFGKQSGMIDESKSPSVLPSKTDTYIRDFNGGYVYYIQRIAKSKHELALKYEWYDPNSQLSSNAFGAMTNFTKAELKYTMIGVGYNYYYNENLKFMFYYNRVYNEKASGILGYEKDLKDDVFTLRMQYRF